MRSPARTNAAGYAVAKWPTLVTAGALLAMTLMLNGCNTAQGVGQDVSATGNAVTRGAAEVKKGL